MRIIAGAWRGRRIAAPPGSATRPTTDRVREAWMSILGAALTNARVLDLFAGSGALGLEALSRGAAQVTFVEQAPAALQALRANLQALGATDRATLVRGDALRFALNQPAGSWDICVADPPYGSGAALALAERFAEVPFARVLAVEHSAREPLPASLDPDTRRYGGTCLSFLRHDL